MILILGLAKPLLFAVYAAYAGFENVRKCYISSGLLVPVERIELPTFGLQNLFVERSGFRIIDCPSKAYR